MGSSSSYSSSNTSNTTSTSTTTFANAFNNALNTTQNFSNIGGLTPSTGETMGGGFNWWILIAGMAGIFGILILFKHH
jgi:hypothetical protein